MKGIGKPATLSSDLRQFIAWSLKRGNFLQAVLSRQKGALEWAQSQEATIKDVTPVEGSSGTAAGSGDVGTQLYAELHAVLALLRVDVSLDLVQITANSNGWKAWRVLTLCPAGCKSHVASSATSLSTPENWKTRSQYTRREHPTKLPDTLRAASSLR